MDTKERHIKENEPHRHDDDIHSDMIADSLKANGKDMKRKDTKKINKLWLWLGVLVLIFLILWWCGIFDILFGVTGGTNG